MSNFFFFLFCGKFFVLEINSKSKWENKMQMLKWNKTRIFNWRPSNSITAAFQDPLIILFQCILFYSDFNIALNFLRTEHVSSFINLCVSLMGFSVSCLSQSGGQWLAVIFWRWKLLSRELCLAPMTCPYGHLSWWSPCCSWISGYQFLGTKSSLISFPVQECQQTKWPARLPLFLSITLICSELWTTSACRVRALLNDALGCSRCSPWLCQV